MCVCVSLALPILLWHFAERLSDAMGKTELVWGDGVLLVNTAQPIRDINTDATHTHSVSE